MQRSTWHLMTLASWRLSSRLVDCSPFPSRLPCNLIRLNQARFSQFESDNHFQELLNPNRWQQLVYQFRSENYRLHQLSSQSMFTVALQYGLACLKTPHCYKQPQFLLSGLPGIMQAMIYKPKLEANLPTWVFLGSARIVDSSL